MSAYAEEYQAYWGAIQRRACALCLDAADDGSCGLPLGGTCALPAELPAIVEAILLVQSDRMDDYVKAIEAAVCARGLYTYLPLVVDAIEEVKSGQEGR